MIRWLLPLAVIGQVSVFPALAWRGLTPDLVLILVVAVGLRYGSQSAMTLGFVGGLALDLLPPADHVAGRWALALLLAGHLAGRFAESLERVPARDRWQRRGLSLLVLGACAFVALSCFALTGLVLRDPLVGVPQALSALLAALVVDVLVAAVALPLLERLDEHLAPDRLLVPEP